MENLPTSKEIQEEVERVLNLTDTSAASIRRYQYPNPLKGYMGPKAILKTVKGGDLSVTSRIKFKKWMDGSRKVKEALTDENISTIVNFELSERSLTAYKVRDGVQNNPFKDHVGARGVYAASKNRKLTRECRNSFRRYLKEQ